MSQRAYKLKLLGNATKTETALYTMNRSGLIGVVMDIGAKMFGFHFRLIA